MTRCGSCGFITPESARFCEGCGRSFKIKYCPSKHVNSRLATFCGVCGSDKLSTPTKARHFSFGSRLAQIFVAICATKVLFPFRATIALYCFWFANLIFSFTFGTSLWSPIRCLTDLFVFWVLGWIILWLIAGKQSDLPKVYLAISKVIFKQMSKVLSQLCRAVWRYLLSKRKTREEDKRK